MACVHFGEFYHPERPRMVRSGLEFRKVVPDGYDDYGTMRFAVTISNSVCDVTFHELDVEHITRFTEGTFDLALWSVVDE